jgi:hypothetical protein
MEKTDWKVFRRFIRKGQTAQRAVMTLWATKLILILALAFAAPLVGHAQTYSLPNDNTGCPSNCRQISWETGSDIWNGGVLPSYTGVTCTGLAGDGVTDDGPAIQACINALSPKQCAVIPAGAYYIDSVVELQSYTCLRGAQPEGAPPFLPTAQSGETRLILGPGNDWNPGQHTSVAALTNQPFSAFNAAGSAGGLFPPQHYGVFPTTNCFLSGTPQKGDTTVTIASGNPAGCAISAGTWLEIYGPDDPNLISSTGTDGFCEWCGNNSGFYLQQQMVQVTNLVGSVATLSKPLYYTINPASQTVPNPVKGGDMVTEPAGVQYSVITFATTQAGFENLRIDGSQNDIYLGDILLLKGCLYCWVKNVETFVTGTQDGSSHIEIDYGYGDEVRDSAFHDERNGGGGAGYGVYFEFSNSDHKIENNILFHNRHWIVYEGGGTGTAVLYNYADDDMTDDCTYFAGGRTSHGGHPFFNLFEGNVASHLTADDFWGSSSHDVMFRNWFRGGEPDYVWPSGNIQTWGSGTLMSPNNQSDCTPTYLFPPEDGFAAVDLYTGQPYYSYVANILGNNSNFPTGDIWSAATLSGFNEYASPATPIVYSYGGQLVVDDSAAGGSTTTTVGASSAATMIRQGNWDYLTNGVAFNDGGNCGGNCTYNPSMYYSSEPSFISSAGCAWPEQGPDLSIHGSLMQPAYMRAVYGSCTTPVAAPPTFSPAAGSYTSALSVIISDTTPGAIFYYTTDGTTPTTSSTLYSGAITVTSPETIEAIATAAGYSTSDVATAVYAGTIVPPPAPFTITGTAVTVAPGAASGNTSTITITPSGGFTGSVQLIAAITNSPSGAVELPTLSFTTNPVINSGTTTLTITTTAPVAATSTISGLVNPNGPGPWYAAGGATLACLLLFGIPARRRSWRTMLGMLVLLVALAGGGVLGCGGTTYNIAQTQGTPGTTAGTYTITVFGTSGTITESGTVSLTVQ